MTVSIPLGSRTGVKKSARVLVVDDEPVIRKVFSRFVTRAGHSVETAEGGAEALELLKSNEYDIVLLDWMMPEVAGIDVLREGTKLRPDLPFVVVTAAYSRKLAQQAMDAGARECIGKPLNHSKALYLIEKYSGLDASAAGTETSVDESTEGQGEIIMVAEPDDLTRELYELIFTHAGYECVLVKDYEEGLAAVEKEYFDAILINGALLIDGECSDIRVLQRHNPYTPILIVGEHTDVEVKQRSLSAGAADFITRPLMLRPFLQRIRKILAIYKEPSASRFGV